MAAAACVWLAFGFSPEEAAGEPGPGPGPWRLEAGPEGISRVWPAWSYVVVDTGERPRPARSPGLRPSRGASAALGRRVPASSCRSKGWRVPFPPCAAAPVASVRPVRPFP